MQRERDVERTAKTIEISGGKRTGVTDKEGRERERETMQCRYDFILSIQTKCEMQLRVIELRTKRL